jgi:hypothetical protein
LGDLKKAQEYSIQYLPSLPLNEHWISENPNKDFWDDLLDSVGEMIDSFSNYKEDLSDSEIKRYKKSVYIDKTVERFEEIEKSLFSHKLTFGSSLGRALETILEAGEKASNRESWGLIHGDLCFSNIIYDQISTYPKLIDPRGSFGKIGIFGDPLYELLKLSQCILGGYDYFASNLFVLDHLDRSFGVEIPAPREHEWFKEKFKEFLEDKLKQLGINFETFRVLEAGLFLSAAPLHQENDRWIALITQSQRILDDIK